MKRFVIAVLAVAALAASAGEARAGENVWYSALFPGWGQSRAGDYGRAVLFAGSEVAALTVLVISDVQYDRAVEQYDRARAAYLGAAYVGDRVEQRAIMLSKWDDAEDLHRYRNVALGAAIGVWVVNVADRILFDAKSEPPVVLETRPGGFALAFVRSF